MRRRECLRCVAFAAAGSAGVRLLGTPFRLFARRVMDPSFEPIERLYLSLGTAVRFQVYHEDRGEGLEAIRRAARLIQKVHNLMSVQDPQSELSAWNRSPRGLDRPLDPLTGSAISEALKFRASTGGLVDPTAGAAVHSFARSLPSDQRTLDWDPVERVLRKSEAALQLDLGGTAKGWAVDRAMDVILKSAADAALVNAGGDLRVYGSPPGSKGWTIGLRNPLQPDEVFTTLVLRDVALATSGDYEEMGSTLIDPRTLSPVMLSGAVSVLAPTCGAADCLATALAVEPDLRRLPPWTRGVVARSRDGALRVVTSPGLLCLASEKR